MTKSLFGGILSPIEKKPEQPLKQTEPAPPAVGDKPRKAIDSAAGAKLTPEEQMALFEKELKENDWGHQPC